jgi:hypothetical protein
MGIMKVALTYLSSNLLSLALMKTAIGSEEYKKCTIFFYKLAAMYDCRERQLSIACKLESRWKYWMRCADN